MATPKKAAPPSVDWQRILQLLVWQRRMEPGGLSVMIEQREADAMDDCMAYLKKKPQVRVLERGDKTFVSVVDAASKVQVRDAEGKQAVNNRPIERPVSDAGFVLLEPGDMVLSIGDTIVPVENNEQDFAASQRAQELQRAREQASQLAMGIKQDAAIGQFSASTINQAMDYLIMLARAR